MNKKSLILGGSLLTLGMLMFGTQKTYAYRGDPSVEGPNYSSERHAEMTQAFENNDYGAWKELMEGKGRVTEIITEGNFARFVEAHNLAVSGDLEGAEAIRNELGLGLGDGYQNGNGLRDGSGAGNRRWKAE